MKIPADYSFQNILFLIQQTLNPKKKNYSFVHSTVSTGRKFGRETSFSCLKGNEVNLLPNLYRRNDHGLLQNGNTKTGKT
jgi:hypothetical protein